MATVTNYSLTAGIGFIVLIVIIVVIIIAICNARRAASWSSSSYSDSKSYRSKHKKRYRVKAGADGERFQAEHRLAHYHPKQSSSSSSNSSSSKSSSSSSSSSSSNSSSSDSFVPGGLGDACLMTEDCSTGLACDNGHCLCPTPAAPVVTLTEEGISTVVVTWTAVPNADYYDVNLYKLTGVSEEADPIEVRRFVRGRTTLIFENLSAGIYKAEVYSGNDRCGTSERAGLGIDTVTIGCEDNNQCVGTTPFCQLGECIQCLSDVNCPLGNRCADGTCAPLRGQGINQLCADQSNCSSGLTCVDQQCICLQPTAIPLPDIAFNVISPSNVLVITWVPIPQADFYQLELFKIDSTTGESIRVGEPIFVDSPTTSYTTAPLEVGGEYFFEITTGSNSCGISGPEATTVSPNFTVPCNAPPAAINNMTISVGNITNNTRPVTLSWASVAGADLYEVILQQVGRPEPVLFAEQSNPSVTAQLAIGQDYTLVVYSVSRNCGTSQPFSTQFTVPDAPCTGPPPAPTSISVVTGNEALPDGRYEVQITWTAPATRVNRYLFELTEIVEDVPQIVFSEFEPSTSITLILSPGIYSVRVSSVSDECGAGINSIIAGPIPVGQEETFACQDNTDCFGNTPFCQLGECIQCRSNADCGLGNVCINNTCVPI